MDVDQSQLGTFRAEFRIPNGYGDLTTLLSQARPDLVHICTPPSTHHPIALECLRGRASVLVEKPPVISLREFDEVAAAEQGALTAQPRGPLTAPARSLPTVVISP
jgi:predicted dehydrogenase